MKTLLQIVCCLLLSSCQQFKLTEGLQVTLLSVSYHKHDHEEKTIEVKNEKTNATDSADSSSAVNDNPFSE